MDKNNRRNCNNNSHNHAGGDRGKVIPLDEYRRKRGRPPASGNVVVTPEYRRVIDTEKLARVFVLIAREMGGEDSASIKIDMETAGKNGKGDAMR